MSKYLKEDCRKHHYESTIKSTHLKHINYITTMREYANEYHHTIQGNAEQLPKRKLSDAMRYYKILFDVTRNMLIQIENNMYEKDVWEESMQLVNFYVDSMETIANYRGTNGKNKSN